MLHMWFFCLRWKAHIKLKLTWITNARVHFVSGLSQPSVGCLIQTQKGSIVIVLRYSSHCLARYLNVVSGMRMLNFETNIKTAILIIVIYMGSEYEVEWRMTWLRTLEIPFNFHSKKKIKFLVMKTCSHLETRFWPHCGLN